MAYRGGNMLVEHHKAKDCCLWLHLQLVWLKTLQLSLFYIFFILGELILLLGCKILKLHKFKISTEFQLQHNMTQTK